MVTAKRKMVKAEIKVEIENGKAKVKIEVGKSKSDLELQTTDLDAILSLIQTTDWFDC